MELGQSSAHLSRLGTEQMFLAFAEARNPNHRVPPPTIDSNHPFDLPILLGSVGSRVLNLNSKFRAHFQQFSLMLPSIIASQMLHSVSLALTPGHHVLQALGDV